MTQDYNSRFRRYDLTTDSGRFLYNTDSIRVGLDMLDELAQKPVKYSGQTAPGMHMETIWQPSVEDIAMIARLKIEDQVDPILRTIHRDSKQGIKASAFLQRRIRDGLQRLPWTFESEGFRGLRRETRNLQRCGTAFQNYLEANIRGE